MPRAMGTVTVLCQGEYDTAHASTCLAPFIIMVCRPSYFKSELHDKRYKHKRHGRYRAFSWVYKRCLGLGKSGDSSTHLAAATIVGTCTFEDLADVFVANAIHDGAFFRLFRQPMQRPAIEG